jgi:hypothetical protein
LASDSAAATLTTASTQRALSSCQSGMKAVSIATAVPPLSAMWSSTKLP